MVMVIVITTILAIIVTREIVDAPCRLDGASSKARMGCRSDRVSRLGGNNYRRPLPRCSSRLVADSTLLELLRRKLALNDGRVEGEWDVGRQCPRDPLPV